MRGTAPRSHVERKETMMGGTAPHHHVESEETMTRRTGPCWCRVERKERGPRREVVVAADTRKWARMLVFDGGRRRRRRWWCVVVVRVGSCTCCCRRLCRHCRPRWQLHLQLLSLSRGWCVWCVGSVGMSDAQLHDVPVDVTRLGKSHVWEVPETKSEVGGIKFLSVIEQKPQKQQKGQKIK
jgi:hypothetical protein